MHSSLDVFPFYNADRDFRYIDGTSLDQAGAAGGADSLGDVLVNQDPWNESGNCGPQPLEAVAMLALWFCYLGVTSHKNLH